MSNFKRSALWRRPWALLLMVAACGVMTAKAPEPAKVHELGPRRGPTAALEDREFRVVHAAPRSFAKPESVITFVFSQAVRELRPASEPEPAGERGPADELGSAASRQAGSARGGDPASDLPLHIEPPIEGSWKWVGTHAVQFVPAANRLPWATQFKVTLDKGVRALSGQTLKEPVTLEFDTPRPKLLSHKPHSNAEGLEPNVPIELRFNQPVVPDSVLRSAELRHNDSQLTLELGTPPENSPNVVVLRPKQPLPIHSHFELALSKGVKPREGSLRMATPERFGFDTYGPLKVKVTCGYRECQPGSRHEIELSNRVRFGDLKRHVLVFPRSKIHWSEWADDDDMVSHVSFFATKRPRAPMTVRVNTGFKDKYGQRLEDAYVQTFKISDYQPSLTLGVEGEVLSPQTGRKMAIQSRNVGDYELVTARVKPDQVTSIIDKRLRFTDVHSLSRAPLKRIDEGQPNQFFTHQVDLTRALGQERGALVVGVRYTAGSHPREQTQLLQLTDLGLTAKLSDEGSLVWVTRLSTQEPVAGARVEIRRSSGKTLGYTTDASGMVEIPAADYVPAFRGEERAALVVRHEDDWTFRSIKDVLSPWRLSVYPRLYEDDRIRSYLFSERGLYRPGQKVWIKGIVREEIRGGKAGGNRVLANRRMTLVLKDPNSNELTKRELKTNGFGTFSAQFQIPTSARLGRWRVEMRGSNGRQDGTHFNSTDFEVAEYRPAEFEVSASSSQPSYINGTQGRWITQADYLFGAPMGGAKLRYALSYEDTWFAPKGLDDFVTDDHAYTRDRDRSAPRAGQLASGEGELDAHGELKVEKKIAIDGLREPKLLRFEADVTDVSRQTLSGSTAAIVHPASYYLGIERFEDWFVEAPEVIAPKVVAVTPAGERVAGRNVALELIRREWTLARESSDAGYRDLVKAVDTRVAQCNLVTRAKEQSCKLSVPKGGYYLVRAKSLDSEQRPVSASMSFYGLGGGAPSWRDSSSDGAVELVPNKKSYQTGDTAKILVKSPFKKARALVSVERDGVLSHEQLTLTGGTPTVEVEVSDRSRPNVYVAVHLLNMQAKLGPNTKAHDVYRVGYAELGVNAEERRLQVEVSPARDEYRPGQTLTTQIRVTDSEGRPKRSEVAFFAVDEGVLTLSGYKVPDPMPVFTAPQALRVATLESRDSLAQLLQLTGKDALDKGIEGGGGGAAARKNFKTSAYFNPSVVTDQDGKAKVSFKLPDNLTTFRLMAVAVTKDDRYGSGFSRVAVNEQLMARPALPRFLRAGDSFEASVVISTKGFAGKEVEVRFSAEGLELKGPSERRIEVESDGSVEVRFSVRAPTVGTARFRFSVTGAGQKDAVELSREVQSPAWLETVAAYGQTQSAEAQRLGDLTTVRPDRGSFEVTLASTRLVGLDGSMKHLVEYPYACTEQLSSRLLPLLPLKELAKAFGFDAPEDARGVAERTVRELLKRQRGDGGFGFWPESRHSAFWLSAYALWVLDLAHDHGIEVPGDVFKRGKTYLRKNAYAAVKAAKSEGDWEAGAFGAYVLAALGEPDAALIERLFGYREDMALFGVAFLSLAASQTESPTELREALQEQLEADVALTGNRAHIQEQERDYFARLMHSNVRTHALVLSALLEADPQHPLASPLVAGLLAERHGAKWRTTQESAFALLAIESYWRKQEAEVPQFTARVWQGKEQLFSKAFAGRDTEAHSYSLPMRKLRQRPGSEFVFERAELDGSAEGTLFYEARLTYAPKKLPERGLDHGFYVKKTLRSVAPEELESAMKRVPHLGTRRLDPDHIVVVDLVVVTPTKRHYVVIDDPLPAGVEAVDSALATSSRRLRALEGSVDSGYSTAWYRKELRDDRALFFVDAMSPGMYHYRYFARATTLGTFIVPPAKVEEMYQPEVFGRTGAIRVRVQ